VFQQPSTYSLTVTQREDDVISVGREELQPRPLTPLNTSTKTIDTMPSLKKLDEWKSQEERNVNVADWQAHILGDEAMEQHILELQEEEDRRDTD